MDALFIAINAKYIHLNPAVRSLVANSRFTTDFREFTIHDTLETMVDDILEAAPALIGISTYIWNVNVVRNLLRVLREHTQTPIVLGGPEVAYDAEHFLTTTSADFIVTGEGEAVIDELIEHVISGAPRPDHNLATLVNTRLCDTPRVPIKDLSTLKSPYAPSHGVADMPHRIVYVESSRGCPYRCSYCLSSRDTGVRFIPVETVVKTLHGVTEMGARTIKFLDRTFNANPNTLALLTSIIETHQPGQTYQFEITGDVLDVRIVDFIHAHAPKGLFRFEIGIQSTHEPTNRSVDRIQDTTKLFSVIRSIRDHDIIDLHLDLIAGLPLETLPRFTQTFNEVYALKARELQLGFLKMLRGTKIRREAARYSYEYDADSPYEIRHHDALSAEDVTRIKGVETALNAYHNKQHIGDLLPEIVEVHGNAFVFFEALHTMTIKRHVDFHRFQLDELYATLDAFIDTHHLPVSMRDRLKRAYVKRFTVKPKCYFPVVKKGVAHHRAINDAALRLGVAAGEVGKHALVFATSDGINVAYYRHGTCRVIDGKNRSLSV